MIWLLTICLLSLTELFSEMSMPSSSGLLAVVEHVGSVTQYREGECTPWGAVRQFRKQVSERNRIGLLLHNFEDVLGKERVILDWAFQKTGAILCSSISLHLIYGLEEAKSGGGWSSSSHTLSRGVGVSGMLLLTWWPSLKWTVWTMFMSNRRTAWLQSVWKNSEI